MMIIIFTVAAVLILGALFRFTAIGLQMRAVVESPRMVELAGNSKLLVTYRRLINELHLYRRASLAQGGALPVSTREHRDIVDKIAAGQPAAAGRALHDHVMASRERMHRTKAPVAASAGPRPSPRQVPAVGGCW